MMGGKKTLVQPLPITAEWFSQSDEKSFGAADVAEPIRLFVLNHFADELRATLAKPGERLVDVVHGEHHA